MINVIGIGQNRENMTLGAIKAIEESDVIIGYKKYISQIEDLIADKEVVKKGMGDEIARAEYAIQRSLEGQTVSLISSGDPGVFGMANVLYQIVSKYDGVEIKVYPGVSALNYASSHLGAPLHDFAAISLSNILTPLSEIEKKLRYALEANLIVAIYNPISKTRKEPFRRFKQCVLDIKGEGQGDLFAYYKKINIADWYVFSMVPENIVEENKVLKEWYKSFGFVHIGTQKFDFFPFTCGYMEKVV